MEKIEASVLYQKQLSNYLENRTPDNLQNLQSAAALAGCLDECLSMTAPLAVAPAGPIELDDDFKSAHPCVFDIEDHAAAHNLAAIAPTVPAANLKNDINVVFAPAVQAKIDNNIAEINKNNRELRSLGNRATAIMIENGRLLIAIKQDVGHSKWTKWLTNNAALFDNVTIRTLQRFMALAEFADGAGKGSGIEQFAPTAAMVRAGILAPEPDEKKIEERERKTLAKLQAKYAKEPHSPTSQKAPPSVNILPSPTPSAMPPPQTIELETGDHPERGPTVGVLVSVLFDAIKRMFQASGIEFVSFYADAFEQSLSITATAKAKAKGPYDDIKFETTIIPNDATILKIHRFGFATVHASTLKQMVQKPPELPNGWLNLILPGVAVQYEHNIKTMQSMTTEHIEEVNALERMIAKKSELKFYVETTPQKKQSKRKKK